MPSSTLYNSCLSSSVPTPWIVHNERRAPTKRRYLIYRQKAHTGFGEHEEWAIKRLFSRDPFTALLSFRNDVRRMSSSLRYKSRSLDDQPGCKHLAGTSLAPVVHLSVGHDFFVLITAHWTLQPHPGCSGALLSMGEGCGPKPTSWETRRICKARIDRKRKKSRRINRQPSWSIAVGPDVVIAPLSLAFPLRLSKNSK